MKLHEISATSSEITAEERQFLQTQRKMNQTIDALFREVNAEFNFKDSEQPYYDNPSLNWNASNDMHRDEGMISTYIALRDRAPADLGSLIDDEDDSEEAKEIAKKLASRQRSSSIAQKMAHSLIKKLDKLDWFLGYSNDAPSMWVTREDVKDAGGLKPSELGGTRGERVYLFFDVRNA